MSALALMTLVLLCQDQLLMSSIAFVPGVYAVVSADRLSDEYGMKTDEKSDAVLLKTLSQSSPGVACVVASPSSWNELGLGPPKAPPDTKMRLKTATAAIAAAALHRPRNLKSFRLTRSHLSLSSRFPGR